MAGASLSTTTCSMLRRQGEEATFDNIEQPVPWKITLVFNLKEQRMSFRYHMNAAGVNVRQVLEGFRFQEAMATGGVLKIQDLETGVEIVDSPVYDRER
jgi:hypothetical protein